MYFYYIKRVIRKLRQPDFRLLISLGLIFLLMILIFAFVLSNYEKNITFADGLWTAYITLTTIGYG